MYRSLLSTIAALVLGLAASAQGKAPERQWTIFLVQHTHTDIGYTRPQSEILSEHLRYIDYALDFCDLTKDYPEGSRFKWTCEAAWPVEQYVKLRPKHQVERLKDCIRRGQIEVTGMYFNMAEIADEEALKYFFHPLECIRKEGIPVSLCMQNDVNGAPWCLADYLPDMGVKYFWIGSNKTKSLLPFNVPTIFRWVSPSGQDVVAFRSMHYMTANFWGIEKQDTAQFARMSAEFLEGIEKDGYPFSEIGIQHEGYFVDNAPPSYKCCDFVREWNRTHENPKLRIATASEFLDYICEKYGRDKLPEYKVAWPDWWTDGFGSAAKETGEARKAHADMTGVTGLLAMARLCGQKLPDSVPGEIEGVYNNLLFYDEHTFGAAESISSPSCWNSQIQFENKASYAWTGLRRAKLLYETAGGLLQDVICPLEEGSITVFNPMMWTRDAYADIFVDFDLIPENKECVLVGEDGDTAPMQAYKRCPEGRYFKVFARNIPSMGYRTYRIELSDKKATEAASGTSTVLENEFYRIETDPSSGGIVSIKDKKASMKELVDNTSQYPLGAFIYETLDTRDVLFQFRSEGFHREIWNEVSIEKGECGPLWESVVLKGKSKAADDKGVSCEIRLYRNEPEIELVYRMNRPAEFKENSVYVAFPFTRENPRLALDVQGGVMHPGENQLEGSSTEWNTLQNFVSARSDSHQIVLGSKEAPILMLGNLMTDGPFHYTKTYDSPAVFSWVMNNYWCTNFKASQQDEFSWSYSITSSNDASDAFAIRNSVSNRIGLYGRAVPSRKGPALPMSGQLLSLDAPECIVALNVSPAAFSDAVILQIKNTSGSDASFCVRGSDGKALPFIRVNALEEKSGKKCSSMSLAGGADIFIKIEP